MKREIKFRGKRVDNGDWVYGYYFVEDGKHYIFNGERFLTSTGFCWGQKVDPDTVGQYRFRDNELKDVYDGDIVDFTFFIYADYEIEKHYTGTIQFDESLHGLTFVFDSDGKKNFYALYELTFDPESDIEVIGNIYENPELLKP